MAAVGALLASSGIALMATTTTATAKPEIHKSYVCKYVGTPENAEVDQSGQNPIWVDNHALEPGGDGIVAKGDLFKDAQGFSVVIVANTPKLTPEPDIGVCTLEEPGDLLATATVSFAEPTCADPAKGSYSTDGSEHAAFVVTGSTNTGDTMTVTATAVGKFEFAEGAQTYWEHTFEAPTGCTVVDPPVVDPPVVDPPEDGTTVEPPIETVVPTVVSAGLAGEPAATGSHRHAGVALVGLGLLVLVGAGGLSLLEGGVR